MSEAIAVPPLIIQFRQRTLPKSEWTHAAHLRVGLWHVLHYSPEETLTRLRDGIRRLNESHGTANTDEGGYHETITRFYVMWIGRFVRERPAWEFDELARELLQAAGDDKTPLQYYSSQTLFSKAARLGWVEPDVKRLEP